MISAAMAASAVFAAFGQSGTTPLRFEVASIKPVEPSVDGSYKVRVRSDAGRLDYSNVSLKAIVQRACEAQISGPDWMSAERFDIVAKLPAGATRSDVPEMLRYLLAERFKVTVHRETRESPAYALVVGKNGPRMTAAESAPAADAVRETRRPASNGGLDCGARREAVAASGWMINKGPGQVQGHSMNMASVANMIAAFLGHPVIDQTGLKGSYDFELAFAPEPPPSAIPSAGDSPVPSAADPIGPSLFAAVQSQLGLKLEAKRGPVEVIVIDHAEKVPTAN